VCKLLRFSDEKVFVVDSSYDRGHLKERIIRDNLIPYICSECGVGKEYNGKLLSLQLDHINGKNNDNRLLNLRFLCPNCHSQTETFSGKQAKKIKQRKPRPRKFDPAKEELAALVSQMPMTKVGAYFGVSDNAIRKRCKLLGIGWREYGIVTT
jgi:hypothetical protein